MESYLILLVDEQSSSRRELSSQIEALDLRFQVVDVPSSEEGFHEFTR